MHTNTAFVEDDLAVCDERVPELSLCVCVCVCAHVRARTLHAQKKIEGRYKSINVLSLAISVVGLRGGFYFLLKALSVVDYTRFCFYEHVFI